MTKRLLTILLSLFLTLSSSGAVKTVNADDDSVEDNSIYETAIQQTDEAESTGQNASDDSDISVLSDKETVIDEESSVSPLNEDNDDEKDDDPSIQEDDFVAPPLTYVDVEFDSTPLLHKNDAEQNQALNTLPSQYSLKDYGYVTSVKDQDPYGTCWTFATMASAESGILKKYGKTVDLAELQLAYYNFNNYHKADPLNLITNDGNYGSITNDNILNFGGNVFLATFSLASGIGFSNESSYPYSLASSYIGGYGTGACYNTAYRLKSARWILMSETSKIKQALMNYGALSVSYYHADNYPYLSKAGTGETVFYQNKTNSTNHAVTLVGWDDNFASTKFPSDNRPSGNGAWLIKNSWGSDWGNDGYFWISYYDRAISNTLACFYEAEIDSNYNPDKTHLYQYDGSSNAKYKTLGRTAYESNIYTAKKTEILKEVGFFSINSQLNYTISVYKNVQGTPTSGTLVATQSGYLEDAGYYLIPLNTSVKVKQDEKFSIVIKLSSSSENIALLVDYSEVNSYDEGKTIRFYNSTAGDLSYYSENGSSWQSLTTEGYSARIKAVTIDYASAYAVLTSNGDLVFFRSDNTYSSSSSQTITINGQTYSGTVYTEFETETNTVPWSTRKESIKKVYVASGHMIQPVSMSGWFSSCNNMISFDGKGFDTSDIDNYNSLFEGCSSLKTVNISTFDTKNVTTMIAMFNSCSSLTSIDLSSFQTTKVTNMAGMFSGCSALKSLRFSNFNTSSVTNMTSMFNGCSSLEALNLTHFNTAKTTSMNAMFYGCTSLKSLDLSSFSTPQVQHMANMFAGCPALAMVKLGSGFTNWVDSAYLPEGDWHLYGGNVFRSEAELYDEYPYRAAEWAGLWYKGSTLPANDIIRIYDASRLAESIKTADELKKVLGVAQFDAIVIAKDSDFADALSGSYLAARKNAPILLINDGNHEEAYSYIRNNLKAEGTIYILGSEASVPSDFVHDMPFYRNVKRLAGTSRYMTNLEILNEAGMTSSGDIFIVTGLGFADSLSSAAVGLPILMVDNNSTALKNSQKKFLQANVTGKVYILGDTNAVNSSLEKQLKTYGPVTRIGGSSRWVTTRMVADQFFSSPDYVVLAYGEDFADGLIASPLAYALHSPLLMAKTGKTGEARKYVAAKNISKAYIIGSKSYIDDATVRKIMQVDENAMIVER